MFFKNPVMEITGCENLGMVQKHEKLDWHFWCQTEERETIRWHIDPDEFGTIAQLLTRINAAVLQRGHEVVDALGD